MSAVTMPNETIYVEIDTPIGTIVLNRPDVFNALTRESRVDLKEAFRLLEEDEDVSVVVIRGAGASLCSGGDLDQLLYLADADPSVDRAYILDLARSFYRMMWDFPKPIVVKAHGYCLGGAYLFLAGADVVVADWDARFGLPEARSYGFDAFVGFWALTLGARWTKLLLYTGDSIDGDTAAKLGLVTCAVPGSEVDEKVDWIARRIAAVDRRVLAIQKEAVNSTFEILGMEAMMRSAMVHNHLSHRSAPAQDFLKSVRDDGVSRTIGARDEPFGGPQRIGGSLPLLDNLFPGGV